jgi:predicted RNase H-like HicB family nuclease
VASAAATLVGVKVPEILRLIGEGWVVPRSPEGEPSPVQTPKQARLGDRLGQDGSTNYSAYAPDLPGVVATGDTLGECEAEMREAIAFHIEGLRSAGEPVPPVTSHVAIVTVAA